MATLMNANAQWSTRPADERFLSLTAMRDHFNTVRQQSREVTVSTRNLEFRPTEDNKSLLCYGPNGVGYEPTHYAFGQAAQRGEAPAGYLRTLPAPMAADCLNFGLKYARSAEEVGVLIQKNGHNVLRAVTGPKYGRIWNNDVLTATVDRFGDGVTGDFRVPGEFGKAVQVTRSNTTLYASEQDFFIFLADEEHRIDVPNRRDGKSGEMARGFFMWNSEVGAQTFGVATFLFDYVCGNRIVWGASDYKEVRIRHTVTAPDRYIEEVAPALISYANAETRSITDGIKAAQEARIDNVDEFLAKRFGKRMAPVLNATHLNEEERPIETLWDAVTAATAYARRIEHQDARVEMEREAGKIMDLVAA